MAGALLTPGWGASQLDCAEPSEVFDGSSVMRCYSNGLKTPDARRDLGLKFAGGHIGLRRSLFTCGRKRDGNYKNTLVRPDSMSLPPNSDPVASMLSAALD